MADNPDLSQFAQAGEAAGRAFAIFYQAFMDGFADQYGCPRPSTAPEVAEDAEEGGLCARCWCDTCAKVDDCDAFPPGDGIRPRPCAACPDDATAPLMPRNAPAECGTYENMPKDCVACWCKECGAFEDCVVEKDGYDPSGKPCPCDGCTNGHRFMPKENPPCDKYTKRG